jgi:hypothetical protein
VIDFAAPRAMLLKADGKDMISAFLSGYALSKIDHLIDTLFKGDIYKDQMVVARLLILFIAMIISFMIAYSYRAYVQQIPEQDDANKESPKEGSKSASTYDAHYCLADTRQANRRSYFCSSRVFPGSFELFRPGFPRQRVLASNSDSNHFDAEVGLCNDRAAQPRR